MALKPITCREHGGTFGIQPRRGRPPVRCTVDNPCKGRQATPDQVAKAAEKAMTAPRRVSQVASEIKNRRLSEAVMEKMPPRQAESNVKPRMRTNASLPMAQAAKAKLEALGWTVKGRAWREDEADLAQVTGARDDETISLTWQDGVLVDQSYSLWSEKPSDNGKPMGKLDFDPSEMTDSELVRVISGMKVTWWNSLAKSEEKAVVGNKLTIEHIYDTSTNGVESVKRLVKFADLSGGGFRAFHVDALLKVG